MSNQSSRVSQSNQNKQAQQVAQRKSSTPSGSVTQSNKSTLTQQQRQTGAAKLAASKSGATKVPFKQNKFETPNPAPAPYLTAAQAAAETKYDTTYGYNIAALQGKQTAANTTEQEKANANSQSAAQGNDNANQAMAARGLFESSIRDSDLNDIATTLAMRNNILQTNLGTLTTSINNQIGTDATDYGTQHNLFNEDAVANAQTETPATGYTTPAVPSPTTPATSVKPTNSSKASSQNFASSPAVAGLAGVAASKTLKPPKNSSSSNSSSSSGGASVSLPTAPAGMGA